MESSYDFAPNKTKLLSIENSELANQFKTIKNRILRFPVAKEVISHGGAFIPDKSSSLYKLNGQYGHLS